MVKNMRIELRVDEDERELWKTAAAKDGLTVSEWLRQLARQETEVAPKMPERTPEKVDDLKVSFTPEQVQSPDFGMNPRPNPEIADKRFKQLVAQLQSRMPLKDAEDEAQRRLGMEN